MPLLSVAQIRDDGASSTMNAMTLTHQPLARRHLRASLLSPAGSAPATAGRRQAASPAPLWLPFCQMLLPGRVEAEPQLPPASPLAQPWVDSGPKPQLPADRGGHVGMGETQLGSESASLTHIAANTWQTPPAQVPGLNTDTRPWRIPGQCSEHPV